MLGALEERARNRAGALGQKTAATHTGLCPDMEHNLLSGGELRVYSVSLCLFSTFSRAAATVGAPSIFVAIDLVGWWGGYIILNV